MPNIGPGELFVILLIALLVFGPRKLPELGKSLGAGIREFRRGTQGLKEELEGSFRETPAARTAPAQPAQTVVVSATPQPVQAVTPQAVTPQTVGQAAGPASDDPPRG